MNNLSTNDSGATGLRLAVSRNPEPIVQPAPDSTDAFEACAVAAPDKVNGVALLHAVREGDLNMVESLLGDGADVNAKDGDGWTALMLATVKGYTEVTRALLDRGADVQATNNKGWTALRFAVSLNDTELIELLLERGADVNDKDNEGNTALMQAAEEKSVESLNLLLAYGADTGLSNHAGETALTIATRHGYSEMIQYLVDAGAVYEGDLTPELDAGLFSEGELERLMERIEGIVPGVAAAESPGVQSLAPVAVPHEALERLASVLEALGAGKSVAATTRISIADIAHKLMLSLPEAAALSGLSRRHLRQAIGDGNIKARKTGQGWRIKRADLEAYVENL